MVRTTSFIIALFTLPHNAWPQPPNPYADQHQREIKALSPQEIHDYLSGAGMGLSKAAELNHFPGPKHVLALAEPLALTASQQEKTRSIIATMTREAQGLGKSLVDQERDLEGWFVSGAVDAATLRTRLDDIARAQAALRRVHLQAHVDERAVLTAQQIAAYDRLRGYGAETAAAPQEHLHH